MRFKYEEARSLNDLFHAWQAGAWRVGQVDALKTMESDWGQIARLAGAEALARDPESTWIHLRRREHLAQTVSPLKGKVTGFWHRVKPQQKAPDVTYFDPYLLRSLSRELQRQEDAWELYFTERHIEAIPFWYEELTGDPQESLWRFWALWSPGEAFPALDTTKFTQTKPVGTSQNVELIEVAKALKAEKWWEGADEETTHPFVGADSLS